MKWKFLAFFFGLLGCGLSAQNTHSLTISLEKIETKVPFLVTQVVDGREDKSNIGWVQKGLGNVRRNAVVPRGIAREMYESLLRNNVMDANGPKTIIRIDYLAISEQTKASSETAKAEVVLDLFLLKGDSAKFIARRHSTQESRGMDVTSKHPRNIVEAFDEILAAFALHFPESDSTTKYIPFAAVEKFETDRESSPLSAPIFVAEKFPTGLYTSFEEFYQNKPSVSSGYEVSPAAGKSIKVKWITQDGATKRVKDDVYAVGYLGEIYVFFNRDFYLLEKRADGLYFVGPPVPDAVDMILGGVLGGALGAAAFGAAGAERTLYKIDLSNGAVRPEGIVQK